MVSFVIFIFFDQKIAGKWMIGFLFSEEEGKLGCFINELGQDEQICVLGTKRGMEN
jgi:hypothetical protein